MSTATDLKVEELEKRIAILEREIAQVQESVRCLEEGKLFGKQVPRETNTLSIKRK